MTTLRPQGVQSIVTQSGMLKVAVMLVLHVVCTKAVQFPLMLSTQTSGMCGICHCRPESNITDILAVNIGCELLKIVPGRVNPACLVLWS